MDQDNQDIKEIIDTISSQLERESGQKIFTIAPLDNRDKPDELEMIVVFENRQILTALVTIDMSGDEIKFRIRGNYIN